MSRAWVTGALRPAGIATLGLVLASGAPLAQPVDAAQAEATPVIVISGQRTPPVALPPTESSTVLDAEMIERRQSSSLFDLVQEAPGVSAAGGPRTSGMKFNIRGFRGNDDVVFKIDGGVKGFEKYRFGSGVFIEPELIKSVTVERGPSLLTGSGAIGGAVVATTKSAADFLRAGERAGGLVKLGYDANSRERLRMLTAFGRPSASTDLLVSLVRRDGSDFKLAGGARSPATATQLEGSLVKLGWAPLDDLQLEFSRTAYRSGPVFTPYDANSSTAGVGGYVHQTVDDETLNLRFTYEPPQSWLKLRGTLAHETTHLLNRMVPGESNFASGCAQAPCTWTPDDSDTGVVHDRWHYDIWTAEVFNDTRWQAGPWQGVLTVGAQALRNRRDLRRLTDNPYQNGPDGRYPDGFDAQQPPGTRSSVAWVLQHAFTLGAVTVTPGLRWDRYTLEADGPAALMRQAAGEPARYRFERHTPSLSLAWKPGAAWWLSYRVIQSFRPPLLNDYFGMEAANPCGGLLDGQGGQLLPHGCGDAVQPTESLNRELTLAWTPPRWASGASTQARLTLYRIDSRHLNGASYLAAEDGRVVQPFREKRRGVEVEVQHERREVYGSFGLSRILAERWRDGQPARPFFAGIPGTTANLSLGRRWQQGRWEAGWRLRQIWDQKVSEARQLNANTQWCGKVTSQGTVHAANTQQDVYAFWRPTERVTLQLGIHNVFDKHWCHAGDELGNEIGLQGPGRSLRLSITAQY